MRVCMRVVIVMSEGGKTNHFFFRSWMAPFELLEDMVVVTGTDYDRVRYYMRRNGVPDNYLSMKPAIVRLKLSCAVFGNSAMGGGGDGGTPENSVFPYAIPYMQLRMLVSEATQRDFYVEYTRAGSPMRFTVQDGNVSEGDAKLRAPIRVPLSKYYFCRAVQADDERCVCTPHFPNADHTLTIAVCT